MDEFLLKMILMVLRCLRVKMMLIWNILYLLMNLVMNIAHKIIVMCLQHIW